MVHGLLSVQAPETGVWTHPVAGAHESLVHVLLSLQSTALWVHEPWALQPSTVHALPSLQELGPDTQAPAEH
jgi:hypothetical protein